MILGSPSVSMDDLTLYMQDLYRVEKMGFDKCFLVHTHTNAPEHIVVDAPKKIRDYITYRENRESLLYRLVSESPLIDRWDLFDRIYAHEDLTDPLRMNLAKTSYNSHIEKLIREGRVKQVMMTETKEAL